MAVVCSVIMVCSPINIFLEKDTLSLKPGSVVLATKCIRELFLMHYGKVKIVDISESVVSQYLESQHKLTRTRLTDIPVAGTQQSCVGCGFNYQPGIFRRGHGYVSYDGLPVSV